MTPEQPVCPQKIFLSGHLKQCKQAAKEKPKAVLGRPITAEPMEIAELTEEASKVVICGEVLTAETRELKGGEMQLLTFAITDYTNTIKCKAFLRYKPR